MGRDGALRRSGLVMPPAQHGERDTAGAGLATLRPACVERLAVSGRLAPEIVQRVVREQRPRLRACYANGLRYNPNLMGRVSARFVIDRGGVARAKPEPDLFLACQEALGVEPVECYVVGDAVWDLLAARRARMLSIGLLSGGYGADELLGAGAFRVYEDASELHRSLDELGFD